MNIFKLVVYKLWYPFFYNEKQTHIYIIAQARSGSSLLMHLLCSNSKIIGFGEEFTVFENKKAVSFSTFNIKFKQSKLFKKYKYIAHQVTSNLRTPNRELLSKNNNKIIVLVRHPKNVIKSMIAIANSKNKKITQEEIASYYINRLDFQKKLMLNVSKKSCCLICYEDLILEPEIELKKISTFLNLKKPLSNNYSLQKFTQISGDPSNNIIQGKIFKTNEHPYKLDIHLFEQTLTAYSNFISDFKN